MVGYKTLIASDPKEQEMRMKWHAAKDAGNTMLKRQVEQELSDYLWNRAQAIIEADKRKHPKAKRNQTFSGTRGEGRFLP